MKYGKTEAKFEDYLASLDPKRQADGKILVDLFEEVTGHPSVLWGDSIIGYGETAKRGRCAVDVKEVVWA